MLVASIDVGIVNLAVAFVEVDDTTFQLGRIVRVENVDSTVWPHVVVSREACMLGHTKTATDRIMHFIQERAQLFDACAHVLIERQPIKGHTDVEQLLFMLYRDRAELVSPNSMHKLLGINHLTYEWRKVKTVEFADAMLDPELFKEYHSMERRHDIADALCLLIYWAYSRCSKVEVPGPPRPPLAACEAREETKRAARPVATAESRSARATAPADSAGSNSSSNPFAKYQFTSQHLETMQKRLKK